MNNETYYTAESVDINEKHVCIDYIISLATVASLFIVSEVLPFLKQKKGNGIADALICCFEGSDCVITKMISCVRGDSDNYKQKQSQAQAQETEQTQALKTDNTQTQNVNINITKKNSVKNMVDDIEKEVGTLDELP